MTLPQKEDFPISNSFTSLTFPSVSSHMNILPLSIDIPLNQTQTDPLVTIHQQSISSSKVIAYFGEDAIVLFGKYYWSKKDNAVVKRGAKRARESSAKNVLAVGEVIWKADTSEMHKGAVETIAAMGVFTATNFQSVSQLSFAFGEKHKELEKAKWELAETQQRYEQQIGQLKQEHEEKKERWKNKVEE